MCPGASRLPDTPPEVISTWTQAINGGPWPSISTKKTRDSDQSTAIEHDPEHSVALLYARRQGRVKIGLALRYGDREWTTAIDTVAGGPLTHRKFTRTTIGLGLRADLSADSFLDVACDVHRLHWLDLGPIYEGIQSDSWQNVSLRARSYLSVSSDLALVPAVEYWTEDHVVPLDWSNLALNRRNTLARLGCGLSYTPDDQELILVSADYRSFSEEETVAVYGTGVTQKQSFRQINLALAVERRYLSWLTLRAGTGFQHYEVDPRTPGAAIIDDSAFVHSVGAGLHLGRIDVDVALTSQEPGRLAPNWDAAYSNDRTAQAEGAWFSAVLRSTF